MSIEIFTHSSTWLALATLVGLEIVLGIDNIVMLAIVCSRLPRELRQKARILGLALAMLMRVALLFSLFWIMKLTAPLFSVLGNEISGRDLILLLGGLFLLVKSTLEIHEESAPKGDSVENDLDSIESKNNSDSINAAKGVSRIFIIAILQIVLLDIVFSLDSVITAVGMAQDLEIMVIAVMVAVFVMMGFSRVISEFVENNPTIKVLALSFLILIGVSLIAEGLDFHINKGYIYFAMCFSLSVESVNIWVQKRRAANNLAINNSAQNSQKR